MLNVDTNLTTGKCNLGTPFKYHMILFYARAVVYPKDINYISPSNIRSDPVWKPAFQFNLHTAFQLSPPSIPDCFNCIHKVH